VAAFQRSVTSEHAGMRTGVGGAYRLDQPDDLAFLAEHGITP
jgi:hypothetical protein